MITSYTAFLAKYNTDHFDLPWLYDPSQLGGALILFLTGLYRPAWWSTITFLGIPLSQMLTAVFVLGALWSCFTCARQIFNHRQSRTPRRYSLLQVPLTILPIHFLAPIFPRKEA
eukprot:m.241507 g.241507  ORF g.241507 m.241507 type:complete len:115 (-) comp54425_c0_seq2:41-385(-)